MHPIPLKRPTVFLLAAIALATTPLTAQDQLTKQAVQRLERAAKAVAEMSAGDADGIRRVEADLDWAARRLQAVYDKRETHYAAAVERLAEVRKELAAKAKAGGADGEAKDGKGAGYDAAALAQLAKEVANAQHNFEIVPTNMLTDSARTRSIQGDLSRLAERLAQFPAADAKVQAVQQSLDGFRRKFEAATQKIAADAAGATAVGAEVETLLATYATANQPRLPEAPIEPEVAEKLAERLVALRDVELPRDLAIAEKALQNTAIDRNRAATLRSWLAVDWPRTVEQVATQLRAQVDTAAAQGVQHADWVLATDPTDRDQVTNRILGRGRFDEQMAHLRRAEADVEAARVHDRVAGATPPRGEEAAVDRAAQAATVTRAIAHLQKLAQTTIEAVRMPPAKSTDAELLAIAAATLQRPEYKVGKWLRLVVNADKVHRERSEATVRPGAVTTSIDVYHYEWDEFQVTTAEQVGDQVWLFANTLKLYSSGDTTTPIGRWILSKRFESTRILPENVAK